MKTCSVGASTGSLVILWPSKVGSSVILLAEKRGKRSSVDFSRIARAQEVKRVMDSRPFTPRELLVRHVEFAAKFGQQKTLDSQVG